MQNSGNSIAKVIIAILAIICVALMVFFIVKNKPDCSGRIDNNDDDYNYYDDNYNDYDDFSVSDGDITFEDNNTEEMDSIPNDAGSPSASDIN